MVSVESQHPIARVYAPYHAIEDIEQRDGSRRVLRWSKGAAGDQDFELFITRTGDDLGFSLLTHDPGDGEDGYFMLTLSPSPELRELEVLPKQVTFVVDTSGSMSGAKIQQARELLTYCIENLSERDTFQVVTFDAVSSAFEEPCGPTGRTCGGPRLRERAAGALNTDLGAPSACRTPRTRAPPTRCSSSPTTCRPRADAGRQHPPRGLQSVSDGDRQIFAFGVGYDVNTRLLDGRRAAGESEYVRPNEDMSDIIGTFYQGIDALLTRLELDFQGVDVRDLYQTRFRTSTATARRGVWSLRRGPLERRGDSWAGGRGRSCWSTGRASRTVTGSTPASWATSGRAAVWRAARRDRRAGGARAATRWSSWPPLGHRDALHELPRGGARDGAPDGRHARGPGAEPVAMPDLGATGAHVLRPAARRGVRPRCAARWPHGGVGAGACFDALGPKGEVGAEVVEESIARNQDRERMVADDGRASVQRVSGRAFAAEGVWVEEGLEQVTPDQTVIAMSEAYFALLRDHPELRQVLALGERVRFRLGRRVIEVRP